MNSNKMIMILGLLLLLVISIGSISANDSLDNNIDMGDQSIDSSNIINGEIISDSASNDNIDSIDDVDSAVSEKNQLSSSSQGSSYKFTQNDYSTYFNRSGNVISSALKSGDTLDFSGDFNSKSFIINIPLTLTSTDGTAKLNDCSFSFISGSSGSTISNLDAKQTSRTQTPIISAFGVSNLNVINNTLYSNQTESYPMSFANVSNVNVLYNHVQCNAYTSSSGWGQPSAILFRNSALCNISSNTVTTNDSNGIYFSGYGAGSSMGTTPEDGSYSNYIYNNTVSSVRALPSSFVYGIAIMSPHNIIFNNTVYNTFREISATASGNQIIGNRISNIHGSY